MNINQLRYFISVATYRSFTKAAECHYMTQTAITQQVRALEENLGLQLIDRQTRPVGLTDAGKVFLREAKSIVAQIDEAVKKAHEADTGMVGTIRIGYEKGYERSSLSDQLRSFHREYPNILFTCFRADTDLLAEKLLSDELDIIFSWDSTNLRQNKEIDSVPVQRSRLSAALYSDHPLARYQTLKREQLMDETIIYMTPSSKGDSFGDARYMQLYEKAGYQPHILVKSNDIESILMMVAAEEGISLLPSYSVEKLDNANGLVFLPLEGEEEYEDIYMMWKQNSGNAALKYLLDFKKRAL